MIKKVKSNVALSLCFGLCLSISGLSAQAQSRLTNGTLIANSSNPQYQKAKSELSPSLYVAYRIVDRIARANGLDERPWRIVIDDNYEVNATQSEVNRISVANGLLDQLAGDSSALACVFGHEIAHSTERHIGKSSAEQKALFDQHNEEFKKKARPKVGIAIANVFLGGRIRQPNASKIKEKKEAELVEAVSEANRQQELEADKLGYDYAVSAGFEPEGCLRMLETLARLPNADIDKQTHPSSPRRIEQMKALLLEKPKSSLEATGKSRLSSTQPLSYEPSKDGASLRINSRRGGSTVSDLEQVIGD